MQPAETAVPQVASRHGSARTSSAFNSIAGNGKVTRVKRLDKATKVRAWLVLCMPAVYLFCVQAVDAVLLTL